MKNWEGKIISIRNCLRYWNIRDLSVQGGRIQVIKILALAKVVYLTASIHTPDCVIKDINKDFFLPFYRSINEIKFVEKSW